jgi:hypothetical protein
MMMMMTMIIIIIIIITIAVATVIVVARFVAHYGIKSGFLFIEVFSNAYFDFLG